MSSPMTSFRTQPTGRHSELRQRWVQFSLGGANRLPRRSGVALPGGAHARRGALVDDRPVDELDDALASACDGRIVGDDQECGRTFGVSRT